MTVRLSACTVLFTFLLLFSCKKEVDRLTSSQSVFLSTVKVKLNEEMSKSDFALLDWSKVVINEQRNIKLIQIPFTDGKEVILAGEANGILSQFRIKPELKKIDNSTKGYILLSDTRNRPLTRLTVTGGRVKKDDIVRYSNGVESATANDPYVELDNILIVSYINSEVATSASLMTWVSLYWLFNMNNAYMNMYTINEYITQEEGGNSSLPIVNEADLFPETDEILRFEEDYKRFMSAREIQIFESMSRLKQLQFLYNAQNSLELAEQMYPNQTTNAKGDAFRHGLFHALNTHWLGEELSKALGDAHELRSTSVLETRMDLYNNEIGRRIALNFTPISTNFMSYRQQIIPVIVSALERGDFVYMSPLNSDGYEIPGITVIKPTNQ